MRRGHDGNGALIVLSNAYVRGRLDRAIEGDLLALALARDWGDRGTLRGLAGSPGQVRGLDWHWLDLAGWSTAGRRAGSVRIKLQ